MDPNAWSVVFVPGLGLSGHSTIPAAERLGCQHRVFIVDPPGCDSRTSSPFTIAGQARVLAAWHHAQGIERALWVGHSFGAQVVVELAVTCPSLVQRLALVSPTVDPSARSMSGQVRRLLLDCTREPFTLLPLLVRDYLKAGVRTLLATGRAAVADGVETKLPAVKVPTLVVRGGRDPLVPAGWAAQVCALLPFGRLLVIPGAAHAVPFSAPGELAQALDCFLDAPA